MVKRAVVHPILKGDLLVTVLINLLVELDGTSSRDEESFDSCDPNLGVIEFVLIIMLSPYQYENDGIIIPIL